jgi:hypothetical protein
MMMSYHDVAFTYDEDILVESFTEVKGLCQEQIARHLSAKSVGRVENVFGFFGAPDLLTALYVCVCVCVTLLHCSLSPPLVFFCWAASTGMQLLTQDDGEGTIPLLC